MLFENVHHACQEPSKKDLENDWSSVDQSPNQIDPNANQLHLAQLKAGLRLSQLEWTLERQVEVEALPQLL